MPSIYFARDVLGRIKVGVTSKPVSGRLAQISFYLPGDLRLIGTIPGDRHLERQIHKQLAAWKLHGEWFEDCKPCREVIQQIMAVSRAAALPAEPEPKPSGKQPNHFRNVCRVLWPEKTAAHLAAATGVSERCAKYWLSGDRAPSHEAFMAVLEKISRREPSKRVTTVTIKPGTSTSRE